VLRWISKFTPSAMRWECSTAKSAASSVSNPSGRISGEGGIASAACRTIRSSSRLTKNTDPPGSPCRPARPRSWSSTRRLSLRPLPITNRPSRPATRSRSAESLPPSRMSTPRPAIWVDTVTAPYAPASAMIAASSASFLALSTTQSTPAALRPAASCSDSLTSSVPTSTGRPLVCCSTISATSASSFSARVA
jgi:hypothetical protein